MKSLKNCILESIKSNVFEAAQASSIEQLFGTLQHSFLDTWREHLKADKHDVHVILDDFYDEIVDLVDKLIEDWMGLNGKVDKFENVLDFDEDPIVYLTNLRDFARDGKKLLEQDELKSDMDDILGLIDSTLYKLKEL